MGAYDDSACRVPSGGNALKTVNVEEMVSATDGSPAVIMRMLRQVAATPTDRGRTRRFRPIELAVDWSLDAVGRSVDLTAAVEIFSIAAVAPRLPVPALERVCGQLGIGQAADLGHVLDALEAEGLIVRSGDDVQVPVRFRDVAAGRAITVLGHRLALVHEILAAHHTDHETPELMIYHLARSDQIADAVSALVKELKARRGRADAIALRSAMEAIPDQVFIESPDLLAARVLLSRLPPTDTARRPDLETALLAITAAELREIPLQRRIIVIAAKVATLTGRGRLDEAIALGGQFVAPSASSGWEAVPTLLEDLSTVLLFTAEAAILAGEPRSGVPMLLRAQNIVASGGGSFAQYRYHSLLALGYALTGNSSLAERELAEARRAGRGFEDIPPSAAYAVPLTDAFLAASSLTAAPLLRAAERFAGFRSEAPIWHALAKMCEAYGEFLAGNPEAGLTALRELLHGVSVQGRSDLVLAVATGLSAEINISLGKPAVAVRDLAGLPQASGHSFCLSVPLASAHLAVGEPLKALTDTDECIALGSAHSLRPLPAVFIRRAIAHEMLGHLDAADESFLDGFLLIRSSPTLAPFVNLSRDILDTLLSRLAATKPEYRADVEKLVRDLDNAKPIFLRGAPAFILSRKERLVLAHLSRSQTIAQLSEELFVSPNTIKSQVSSIYRKLGVKNRREAIILALAMGLSETEQ